MKIFLVTQDPTLFDQLRPALSPAHELRLLRYPQHLPSAIEQRGKPDLVLFDQPPEEDNLNLKFYAAAKELTGTGYKVMLMVRYFNSGTQVAAMVNANAFCVPRNLPPQKLLQEIETAANIELSP